MSYDGFFMLLSTHLPLHCQQVCSTIVMLEVMLEIVYLELTRSVAGHFVIYGVCERKEFGFIGLLPLIHEICHNQKLSTLLGGTTKTSNL